MNKMVDGDYVSDGLGGLVRLRGNEALLQEALFRLSCRRGSFPMLPRLGSDLYLLHRKKSSDYRDFAIAAAQEAVEPLGLRVTDAAIVDRNGMLCVSLILEGGTILEVSV